MVQPTRSERRFLVQNQTRAKFLLALLTLSCLSLYHCPAAAPTATPIVTIPAARPAATTTTNAARLLQSHVKSARTSCNAAYSLTCARTISQQLAIDVADELRAFANADGYIDDEHLRVVTDAASNRETGFYPYVVERDTMIIRAHGRSEDFVGRTTQMIFDDIGLVNYDAQDLHQRSIAAADGGGGFVQYLFLGDDEVNAKVAYVAALTSRYYVAVGYTNKQMPPDAPCDDNYDAWCSLNNVRSLVGHAQTELSLALSLEQFQQTVWKMSRSESYRIDGGFYNFMYSMQDGKLESHAVLHDYFGMTLADMVVQQGIGTKEYGMRLHQRFIEAANGHNDGWLQYEWTNTQGEAPRTKIAFITKVEIQGKEFYLGSGFYLQRGPALSGPFGQPCTEDTNLPCAFRTALELTSHALSYAISSPRSPEAVLDAWSTEPQFREGEFYIFAYDYNSTCLALGVEPELRGKTMRQIFEGENGIPLDTQELNQAFIDTAESDGGFVVYNWATPDRPNIIFEKISYVFKLQLDHRDIYAGVGFTNRRARIEPFVGGGLRDNGGKWIDCEPNLGFDCSEINAQAVLGQAMADVTVATSQAIVTIQHKQSRSIDDVLEGITNGEARYRFHDFAVSVFSSDGAECATVDNSGCLLASTLDPSLVGKTWQEILDEKGVVSVKGSELHEGLSAQANLDGGVYEYPWLVQASGEASQKRAWTARYRHKGRMFYVVSEYELPQSQPTPCKVCYEISDDDAADQNLRFSNNLSTTDCDNNCDDGFKCSGADQDFCPLIKSESEPSTLSFVFAIAALIIMPAVAYGFILRAKRKGKLKVRAMAAQLLKQMQGIVHVDHALAIRGIDDYDRLLQQHHTTHVQVVWYWKEDTRSLSKYEKGEVLPNTNFVRYASQVLNDSIESIYQQYQKKGGAAAEFTIMAATSVEDYGVTMATGDDYVLNFQHMFQRNMRTQRIRKIERREFITVIDEHAKENLPELPSDLRHVDSEDLLPLIEGQLIQISKIHPKNSKWAYGHVLHDPLLEGEMDDATEIADDSESSVEMGNSMMLSQIWHTRPQSGWFPAELTSAASASDMRKLAGALGDNAKLAPPSSWQYEETSNGLTYFEGLVDLAETDPEAKPEYDKVVGYIHLSLADEKDRFEILKVERVQNSSLWQPYVVKRETIAKRDREDPNRRVHNKDPTDIERKWLFHGTRADTVEKIYTQGFDRNFAGRSNAAKHGMGVYFAVNASYSCCDTYSAPDERGVKRMFLSRVIVGDWCVGRNNEPSPDYKSGKPLQRFDTTVDRLVDPNLFVAYQDAQAYPEYLVTFIPRSKSV